MGVEWKREWRRLQKWKNCSVSGLGADYVGDVHKNSLNRTFKMNALHMLYCMHVTCQEKRQKEWTQLELKLPETSGNEYSKPCNNLLPFLVPNPFFFCLLCQVSKASLLRLQIPVVYGLLTVQPEVGWWSDRPTVSWWNQDLHACLWIENPPSHPSRPGFPRLTLH